LPAPLFNLSQEVCGIPLDTVPPCPPMLTVANPCELATPGTPAEAFFNTLNWTNPINTCPETDDVVTYNIYFAPVEGGDFTLIETVTFSLDTIYEHQSDLGIAGCYAITALDTLGNESDFSNIFCVDNCPFYALPNAFTPNADNQNDLFIPYAYRFIDHIEFQVFNRWGVLVFETTDPSINWNGRNFEDKELAEGTYFYSCRVFEIRVNGVVPAPEILSGYIELIR
jgi:gliding motility-associated-like protein